MKKHGYKKAFTLIELVIVIVILGILAGVAALSYSNVTTASKDSVAKTNVRLIKSALIFYQYKSEGNLPESISDIKSSTESDAMVLKNLMESDAYSNPEGYIYSWDKNLKSVTVTGGGLGAGFTMTMGN